MTASADGPPTPKWIAGWTLANIVFLALQLQVGRGTARFVTFLIGFTGMLVVAFVTMRRPRPLARCLPVVVSTGIVGLWPLYRFVVHGDSRTAGFFLGVVGLCLAVVVLVAAHQWVRQRGWVVDSPRRRGATFIAMAAMVTTSLLDVEHPVLRWGVIVLIFATMFWPSRWRAVSHKV